MTIGYAHTPAVRDAAHAHDARLRDAGAISSIACSPVQVRINRAQGVRTDSGAYMRSEMPIAGFMLIEAPNLIAAIAAVAQAPCAVAGGVVEVWPLEPMP